MFKSVKIKEETLEALQNIKMIDDYSSVDEVIQDLLKKVPQKQESIREAPAWKWKVGFDNKHEPNQTLEVSWQELRKSKPEDTWNLSGESEFYEATILFKDEKGTFVRFGEQIHDDEEMFFYTEYFQFK